MAALNRWPASLFMQLLLRSFLLQASWNFSRLQNLGFLYVLLPGLRRLYPADSLADACQRHLEYFNSHPFLAPGILGTTLHLEREVANGRAESGSVNEFKTMVMAPYAAMGDAFFWGGVRPMAAAVALLLAFKGSLWAPVVFLVLFNLPHLAFRVFGLFKGLDQGLGLIHVIQRYRLPDLAIRAKEATVVLLGGFLAFSTLTTTRAEGVMSGWGLLVLPVVALVTLLGRKGRSTLVVLLSGLVMIALLGPML